VQQGGEERALRIDAMAEGEGDCESLHAHHMGEAAPFEALLQLVAEGADKVGG
jgi:hypothetical protein